MFKGKYLYTVDSKNRLSIPAKLRKYISQEAQNTIIIQLGLNKCLQLYPYDKYKTMMERLNKLNPFDPEQAYVKRRILEEVYEEELDGQYRIKLPAELLKKVNITRDVIILGQSDYMEVWDPEEYEKYKNEFAEPYEKVVQRVMNE